MRRVLLAGALLLLACARRPSPAPSQSSSAAGAAPATEKRLEAFRRCQDASERLQRAQGPGRAAQLARACADVYSEPGCAAVMRNPPERPEAMGAAIAQACRDAYCPRLSAPRPSLCATRELPPPIELARRWRELQNRILALELDVSPDQLEKLAPPVKVTVSKQLAPAAPALPPLVVRVAPEKEGARVSIADRSETLLLDAGGTRDALAAFFRRARASVPAATGVVLDAPPSVDYEIVARVLDGARAAGFTDITFESAHR